MVKRKKRAMSNVTEPSISLEKQLLGMLSARFAPLRRMALYCVAMLLAGLSRMDSSTRRGPTQNLFRHRDGSGTIPLCEYICEDLSSLTAVRELFLRQQVTSSLTSGPCRILRTRSFHQQ
jgi:hypothetical protein